MSVWFLHITSFRGISIGAVHWYGKLYHDLTKDIPVIELDRPLTSKEIARMNKEEGHRIWFQGGSTKGFNSRDDVKQAAMQKYYEVSTEGDILLEGNHCSAEPMPVLIAPPEKQHLLEAIYSAWSSCRNSSLLDEWDKALGSI